MSTLESKKKCRSCKYSNLEMGQFPCSYCTVPQIRKDYFTPNTNLDKIRQMPVEEMAKILNNNHNLVDFCKNLNDCNRMLELDKEIPEKWCQGCAKEWLEREVEE